MISSLTNALVDQTNTTKMRTSLVHPLFFSSLCLLLLDVSAQGGRQEWEANNYPNPTADGYVRCNMKSPSSVCDPDAVLTEAQRYRLNYELTQLESRTRQVQGQSFCEKKGIVAAIALAKHVRGASENAVKMMANDILRRWSLDKQCSKSLVIVVATEDKKFWVARDNRVPVYATEFTDIFNNQKPLFKDGNYPQALLNVIESTWDKALAKQGQGDSRGTPFDPSSPKDRGQGQRPSTKSDSSFSLPSIPTWIWIALVLVIIPTLCCCCCVYFCCCRKSAEGGSNKRQGPSDLPDEEYGGQPAPRGRGLGGGGGMSGLLGGLGAGAIGSSVSNWFRNRSAGHSQPVPPDARQDPSAPGQPAQKGGRGLYPSADVKDEGGGGSW